MILQPMQIDRCVWGTTPVRLLAWLVEPGESVTMGEPLAELAQPGIVGYLVAPCDGILHGPLSHCGDIDPGSTLGWIEPAIP